MNKYKEEQTKNEDTSDDNYYRSLFCNPYMNK